MKLDPVALRVIEAVARHGNLTRAASALGISQPAVSYRLAQAEGVLGCKLFLRDASGCRPTEAGASLLAVLVPALARIDDAVADLQALQHAPGLRVRTDFAFAGLWLMPRFARFRAARPDLAAQIVAGHSVAPPGPGEVVIRFARREGAVEGSWLAFPERVVPVAAPGVGFAGSMDARLIHLEGPPGAEWLDWPGWFGALGLQRPRRAGELVLNTLDLVLQAAEAGEGVALAWLPIVTPRLTAGQLVAVGPERVRQDRGYWIETLTPGAPGHRLFLDWLAAELAAELVAEAGQPGSR